MKAKNSSMSLSCAAKSFAVGGVGALAALIHAPSANANVQVGIGVPGYWLGTDPAGTTKSVGMIGLSSFGGGFLVLTAKSLVGAGSSKLVFNQYAMYLSSHATWGLTACGTNLPSAASLWSLNVGPFGSQSLVTSAGASSVYWGYQVTSLSGTSYYWVEVDPNPSGLEICGYGTLPASAGSGGGGAAGGGPGGATGTPEPAAAGLGLLALGAAGVMRHKRRKQAA